MRDGIPYSPCSGLQAFINRSFTILPYLSQSECGIIMGGEGAAIRGDHGDEGADWRPQGDTA